MDQKIAGNCWARDNCKQHGKLCGSTCLWNIELTLQMQWSNIPKRFQHWNVDRLPEDTFGKAVWKKWSGSDLERISSGQGLFLTGGTGTGKTTILTALAQSYIINRTLSDLRNGRRTPHLVMFVNTPDYLSLLKHGISNEESRKEADQITEALKTCDLAIFDDIGSERISEFVREALLIPINERYTNEKSTFFSSNLTLDEIGEVLDKRIASRISALTVPIEVKGPDRRRKSI